MDEYALGKTIQWLEMMFKSSKARKKMKNYIGNFFGITNHGIDQPQLLSKYQEFFNYIS